MCHVVLARPQHVSYVCSYDSRACVRACVHACRACRLFLSGHISQKAWSIWSQHDENESFLLESCNVQANTAAKSVFFTQMCLHTFLGLTFQTPIIFKDNRRQRSKYLILLKKRSKAGWENPIFFFYIYFIWFGLSSPQKAKPVGLWRCWFHSHMTCTILIPETSPGTTPEGESFKLHSWCS